MQREELSRRSVELLFRSAPAVRIRSTGTVLSAPPTHLPWTRGEDLFGLRKDRGRFVRCSTPATTPLWGPHASAS
jgi:hypothetical protein